jgi:hypothetical protein
MGRSENTFKPNDRVCTPRTILDPIVETLGPILFDPCSNPSSIVGAKVSLLLPEYRPAGVPDVLFLGDDTVIFGDALEVSWGGMGLTFWNPPYSRLSRAPWVLKALEADEAIGFLPVRTAGAWWQKQVTKHTLVTFLNFRVKHVAEKDPSPFHQCLIYQGPRAELWKKRADRLGWTVRP